MCIRVWFFSSAVYLESKYEGWLCCTNCKQNIFKSPFFLSYFFFLCSHLLFDNLCYLVFDCLKKVMVVLYSFYFSFFFFFAFNFVCFFAKFLWVRKSPRHVHSFIFLCEFGKNESSPMIFSCQVCNFCKCSFIVNIFFSNGFSWFSFPIFVFDSIF
jgi:hypothetical protein